MGLTIYQHQFLVSGLTFDATAMFQRKIIELVRENVKVQNEVTARDFNPMSTRISKALLRQIYSNRCAKPAIQKAPQKALDPISLGDLLQEASSSACDSSPGISGLSYGIFAGLPLRWQRILHQAVQPAGSPSCYSAVCQAVQVHAHAQRGPIHECQARSRVADHRLFHQ